MQYITSKTTMKMEAKCLSYLEECFDSSVYLVFSGLIVREFDLYYPDINCYVYSCQTVIYVVHIYFLVGLCCSHESCS